MQSENKTKNNPVIFPLTKLTDWSEHFRCWGLCPYNSDALQPSKLAWRNLYWSHQAECPHVMFFVCLIACFFFLLSWHTELNIGSLSGTSRLHMTEHFPSDWRWMTSWRGKSNLLLRCLVNCQYLSRRFSCYLNKNLNVSLFFIHFSDKFLFFHIKSSK